MISGISNILKAESGKNGSGKNRTGHNGKDTVIKVPVGTVILSENKKQIYKDFKKRGLFDIRRRIRW